MLKTLIALSTVAAAFAVAPAAHAANDYYLKLDGMPGESARRQGDGRDRDPFASSWGVENQDDARVRRAVARARARPVQGVQIEKNVDSTTPVLFAAHRAPAAPIVKGMELVALRAGAQGSSI